MSFNLQLGYLPVSAGNENTTLSGLSSAGHASGTEYFGTPATSY